MNYKKIISLITLLLSDILILIITYLIAYLLRAYLLPIIFPWLVPILPFQIFISRFYLVLPYLLIFAYEGLYTRRFDFWEETRRLYKSNLIATAIIMIILYITRGFVVSRLIILLVCLLNFILLPLHRFVIKKILLKLQFWSKNLLVISAKETYQTLINLLRHHTTLGYQPTTFIEAHQISNSDIDLVLRKEKIDSIIVSGSDLMQTELLKIYEQAEGKIEDFFVIPELSQLQTVGIDVEQWESLLVMKFRYNLLRRESQIVKRIIDLTLASLLFIIAMPFFLLIAIMIKVSSQGPILFIQNRLGKNKKVFSCYKFRTMYLDADKRLDKILYSYPELKMEWQKYMKISNDPRVTPIGRFLRRTSLDELPQLWNVIKNEMSLVGPRPYLIREVEELQEAMDIICRVKPGLTGLWQVSGRSDLSFEERMRLDEHYVKNWTIWMDLVILIKTIKVVIKAQGAY